MRDGDIPSEASSAAGVHTSDDEGLHASQSFSSALGVRKYARRCTGRHYVNRKIPFAKVVVDPDIQQILLVAELHIFGALPEHLMATTWACRWSADHYTLLQKRWRKRRAR